MEATNKINLFRDAQPQEVIDYIIKRIKEGRVRVAILAPTNKDAKVLFKQFKARMDEKPISEYSFSAEFENGSKVMAASINTIQMIGESLELIYIDSLAQVDYESAEEFWQTRYPTVCTSQTKVIITHGKDYFEKLWESRNEDV